MHAIRVVACAGGFTKMKMTQVTATDRDQRAMAKQVRQIGRRYVRLNKAHAEGKHVQCAINCARCRAEVRCAL